MIKTWAVWSGVGLPFTWNRRLVRCWCAMGHLRNSPISISTRPGPSGAKLEVWETRVLSVLKEELFKPCLDSWMIRLLPDWLLWIFGELHPFRRSMHQVIVYLKVHIRVSIATWVNFELLFCVVVGRSFTLISCGSLRFSAGWSWFHSSTAAVGKQFRIVIWHIARMKLGVGY